MMKEWNEILSKTWRAKSIMIHVPDGDVAWITDIAFAEPARFMMRFTSSNRYVEVWDLAMGYDSISVRDLNTEGNHLEFGRYEISIWVDDECAKFRVDSVELIDEDVNQGMGPMR